MAKVLQCPNCNAEIAYKGYNQRVKCEYCHSNVIISIDEVLMNELYQQNGDSIDNLSEQKISQMKQDLLVEEYKARNKGWIKKVVIAAIIIFFIAFLTGLSSINVFEGNIAGSISTALLWIVVAVLGFGKPVSPLKKAVSSKVTAGIVVYVITHIVLTLGYFAAVITNVIINPKEPESGYTIFLGDSKYHFEF